MLSRSNTKQTERSEQVLSTKYREQKKKKSPTTQKTKIEKIINKSLPINQEDHKNNSIQTEENIIKQVETYQGKEKEEYSKAFSTLAKKLNEAKLQHRPIKNNIEFAMCQRNTERHYSTRDKEEMKNQKPNMTNGQNS